MVSLFNDISTLFRLFNAKTILLEEQSWYYLTHSWEDKGVHTFPKGICPKVNVIARLEYELAYYDSAVHRFNHYTTRTPPDIFWKIDLKVLMSIARVGYTVMRHQETGQNKTKSNNKGRGQFEQSHQFVQHYTTEPISWKNVSAFTVKRRLSEAGLYARIAVKKPLLRKQNNVKNL